MSVTTDIKKLILKHSVIRYLQYAELDDEVYELILDKNVALLLEENKRLKEENTKLKMEGMLAQQPTIDLEINGKQTALTKDELLQLFAKYKEKELTETKPKNIEDNRFIPQDIVAITTGTYDIGRFYCHYEDEFGKKQSLMTSQGFEKLQLFFDLFALIITDFNEQTDTFLLHNLNAEWLMVSKNTVLTHEFLSNFAKGKEYIRNVVSTVSQETSLAEDTH